MANINPIFCRWVDEDAGSQAQAARLLSKSKQLISFVYRGELPVSKNLAELVEAVSDGRYKKEALLWPEPKSDQSN